MKFRPLHDRVLIKVLDSEEKTSGGIIIPDTAKEKPQEGEVVAVGPGAKTEEGKLIKMDVKVGDLIRPDMLAVKRPGTGIPPNMLKNVVGRRLVTSQKADTVLHWEHVE